MTFRELGVAEELCNSLEKEQILKPTPIQEKAIPIALTGKDIIASARTGTGKTLAFSLPMIGNLLNAPEAKALVLVPTRELAMQVHVVLRSLMAAVKLPAPCMLIGGVAFGPQFDGLRKNPRVIVATPGRLLDHIKNGKLKLDRMHTLVLDEADRMLDMGFLPQVRKAIQYLPKERQILLFTATMPNDLQKVLKEILRSPERVFVDPTSTTAPKIDQQMQAVSQDGKYDILLDAINSASESVLVFTRTKRRADRVCSFLKEYGVYSDSIHGDKSQAQRKKAIDAFRSGKMKVLVATDIAARGLDIPVVELVVNFDLPEARDDYVHRIGRTGRAGATGRALSYVAPEETRHWEYIIGKRSVGTPGMHRNQNSKQGPRQNRTQRQERGPKRSAKPMSKQEDSREDTRHFEEQTEGRFEKRFEKRGFEKRGKKNKFQRAPREEDNRRRFHRESINIGEPENSRGNEKNRSRFFHERRQDQKFKGGRKFGEKFNDSSRSRFGSQSRDKFREEDRDGGWRSGDGRGADRKREGKRNNFGDRDRGGDWQNKPRKNRGKRDFEKYPA